MRDSPSPSTTPADDSSSRRERVTRAAALALGWGLGGLAVLFGFVRCPLARWVHNPCPGCGMQRAVLLFLHGDFAGSVAMNALAVPVALAVLALASTNVALALTRGTPASRLVAHFGRIAFGAFIVFEVLAVILWALRFGGLFGGPVSI